MLMNHIEDGSADKRILKHDLSAMKSPKNAANFRSPKNNTTPKST